MQPHAQPVLTATKDAPPLIHIRPGSRALDLRHLLAYRDVLWILVWRDIKVRYKQTALGAAWAILQPFSAMLVFTLFLGRLAGVPSDGLPYPLFVYAGLLPWLFVSNAIASAANSLIENPRLVTQVYFPRIVIPAAAVLAALVDFFIAAGVMAVLQACFGVTPDWRLALFPMVVALATLLAFAIGTWVAALNVRFRDFRYLLPFALQLWMFATPIVYPASLVPAEWRWVVFVNPMAGIVEGARSTLFGRPLEVHAITVSGIATAILLVTAFITFYRQEQRFADML
jgi:lipopolysaccharide transport system permease protein